MKEKTIYLLTALIVCVFVLLPCADLVRAAFVWLKNGNWTLHTLKDVIGSLSEVHTGWVGLDKIYEWARNHWFGWSFFFFFGFVILSMRRR